MVLKRVPLWTDKRAVTGPFDIIGDVHGCLPELQCLLGELGYQVQQVEDGEEKRFDVVPPAGRQAVFVGDLVDRGPDSPGSLRLVMDMVDAGHALCVLGNHDAKLLRKLNGRDVKLTHGLDVTMEQLESESAEFVERVRKFLYGLVSHYMLDKGRLVVAHAGLKEDLQGRASGVVRSFALYGDTSGEIDEFGLPVRHPWASEYRGKAMVVYGHTPVPEPEWLNKTVCVDTGCVFGGALTALRYPEQELVTVPADAVHCEPTRPLVAELSADARSAQQADDDLLHLEDVFGKRIVSTRLRPNITIREENSTAALEVMTRFAVDPRWLIYLPPTMSPTETTEREGYLEYPTEGFSYFRKQGVSRVVCEEKHMGSRAVVIVCRDASVPQRRFGIEGNGVGVVTTRTGRKFFNDDAMELAFLERVRDAADRAGLFETLATDWLCLDCELMPWSAKARSLIEQQYAPVGAAGTHALGHVAGVLQQAVERGLPLEEMHAATEQRRDMVERYVHAYREYCWPVNSLDDYRLAPFHLLAYEGHVAVDRDHGWHMETLATLCAADPKLLLATHYKVVELNDPAAEAAAIAWWEERTEAGGEGMVIKPWDFVARGKKGLMQPAVKCRGREYLRIIYGPEYTAPENLARLRKRAVGRKRSLAMREFALGVEALERFVAGQPLRRVHECVFGVLAMESEPVDPRL